MFDISIIHKCYKFYLALHARVILFPKQDRHSLGQKCEELALEVLELLFTANAEQNTDKIPLLKKVDVKLKILKTLIRLCFDCKTLDQKNYLALEELLQELGRMLGGWMKALKTQNPA